MKAFGRSGSDAWVTGLSQKFRILRIPRCLEYFRSTVHIRMTWTLVVSDLGNWIYNCIDWLVCDGGRHLARRLNGMEDQTICY